MRAGLRYSYDDKSFKYNAPPVSSVITRLNATPINPSGNVLGYSTDGWEHIDEDWDDWQLDIFVANLLNEQHRIFEQDVGAGPASCRGDPRYWGVAATARF